MQSVPANPTNPIANNVKTIVAKLIYGAVPINVNSIENFHYWAYLDSFNKNFNIIIVPKTKEKSNFFSCLFDF